MRIAEIHLYEVDLPMADGQYVMASTTVGQLTSTLVRLVGVDGTEGWGETCPVGPTYAPQHSGGAKAALIEMAPGLIGARADHPLLLSRRMEQLLNGHAYAKAAIDIAAYDLHARHLGVRVCDLLGGAERQRLPAYYATSVGTPDDIAQIAQDRVAEGYPRLQIKVGGRPIEADIETLAKVRERIGPAIPVAVDANRGWTSRDTIEFSRACANLPCIIEQPCDSIEEILAIRAQLNHPVFVDESSVRLAEITRLAAGRLCDGFGLKLTRIGGLTPMRTVRDVCEALSLPHTCDDAWGSDIIAAACVHVAATVSPKLLEGVWIAAPHIALHYDPIAPIAARNGYLDLPSGPGLGVTPDLAQIGSPFASFGLGQPEAVATLSRERENVV
ncbi:MAG: mandelate racemase/muconate lactonizing enzyme family protein [Pseudomonadota bacterium]